MHPSVLYADKQIFDDNRLCRSVLNDEISLLWCRGGAMSQSPVIIRRAAVVDAPAMAEVWLRSFAAALPTVRRVHSDDDVRAHFSDVILPQRESWVAVVGLLVLGDGFVEQLYLEPGWRGRGIGDRLVALAKRGRSDGLQLWTFQANESARRFYRRHGFREVEWTDGRGNEEREPDVRCAWSSARDVLAQRSRS